MKIVASCCHIFFPIFGTPLMSEAAKPAIRKARAISLKKNSVRAVLGLTVWGLCFSHVVTDQTDLIHGLFAAALMAYVAGTGIWLRIAKQREATKTLYTPITTLDAFVYSASLAYFCFNYSVAGIVFCLVVLHAMIIGGFKQLVNDTGAFFIAAASITLATNTPWILGLDIVSAIIIFVGASAYSIIFGYYVNSRVNRLNATNQKLQNDVVLHKLRGYKLSRFVSPTVWNALNQGRESTLKTERKRISVFFSDIAGFSSLSEELEAETLTELLNTYLTEMVKIATTHHGTIDKFMGDGLMVIFGDTNSDGMKADCLRCVSMAVDMRKKMRELETKWFNQGIKKPLKIRMGINSGYCTVGTFGTNEYMDYTVLGTHVNLASRLESAADSGEILISHETWSLIKDVVMCRDRGEIKAKGFSSPIKVYQVVDFRKDMGRNQSYFEEHSNGFSIHLDLEKIKNYDKSRIVQHLEKLAEKVKDKI